MSENKNVTWGIRRQTSPLLTCPHGFFTRTGGISTGCYATFNTGYDIGDAAEAVLENRRRLTACFDLTVSEAIWMSQVHGTEIRYFTETPSYVPECDGLVTDRPGLLLCVKTADCVPILFQDEEHGVIGAVHAGWRGTAADIVSACIKEMVRHGAAPASIRAAIGPGIHACCYEVDAPFTDAVRTLRGQDFCDRFIRDSHADLIGMNEYLLREAGVTRISILPDCTCCQPDVYFSHRYTKGKRGVQTSAIRL